jgi:hypothetical protein
VVQCGKVVMSWLEDPQAAVDSLAGMGSEATYLRGVPRARTPGQSPK